MAEFNVGDKVRVKDDQDSIESMQDFHIPVEDIEAMKGKVFEVLNIDENTYMQLRAPRGATWWFKPEHVTAADEEPREFTVGDKVKVVGTVESLVELGIRESRAKEMVGKTFEILKIKADCRTSKRSYKGHQLNTSKGTGWDANYWVEAKDLELADASDVDEPDWDPMTEPIHLGDLVEIVFNDGDNSHTGKKGRVTRCDNPEKGRWGVTAEDGKSAGDSWSRRSSLKLLEKAEGSPKSTAGVKAKESPPPGLAKGDEVRILHSTREFQAMGHPVLQAARLSRRKGKIILTDGVEPKWYVDAGDAGGAWCHTDKLEKLTA